MVYPGETYTSTKTVTIDGEPTDPDTITISVIDPDDVILVNAATPNNDDIGEYSYDYTLLDNATAGSYTFRWVITIDDESETIDEIVIVESIDFYSSVDEVIEDTGVSPGDFEFETDQELEAKITKYLIEAKGLIDTAASEISERLRDFTQEVVDEKITEIPVCIHDVAKRIAINKVKQAMINRETPIVNKDDYQIQVTNDTIMTRAIMEDLNRCVGGRSKSEDQTGLGIIRIRTHHHHRHHHHDDDDINWI